ncbi:MAG: hypothetical protein LJE70_13360 [Chromatiaceae bacterium]|nr:hypothetical protein [Chromatiaceae bacterium]
MSLLPTPPSLKNCFSSRWGDAAFGRQSRLSRTHHADEEDHAAPVNLDVTLKLVKLVVPSDEQTGVRGL